MLCIHGCICAFTVCVLMRVNCDIVCIAYEVMSCVCLGGLGMYEVYMLESVDERTPQCGTPS